MDIRNIWTRTIWFVVQAKPHHKRLAAVGSPFGCGCVYRRIRARAKGLSLRPVLDAIDKAHGLIKKSCLVATEAGCAELCR